MKQFPGLTKRKGGNFRFVKQINHVRTFTELGTDDLAEAVRRASLLARAPIDPSDATVLDLIEPFLQHKTALKRYSEASVYSKRYTLQKFGRFAGCAPQRVSQKMMQSFCESEAAAGLSATTVMGYVASIRGFFRWCVVKKYCRDNPCVNLELTRVSTAARKDFCSPEQVQSLIDGCPRDDLKFILFCGFHAGLRKNEIIEARAFWFDTVSRKIHLKKHDSIQFKDLEERSIPMTREFAEFLAGYGMREPYMLHQEVKRGKSLYRYDFERFFNDYVNSQGIPFRITTHTMRHTFASLLVSAQADGGGPAYSIFEVAVWLGDHVKVVQKHYAKLLPEKRDVGSAFRSVGHLPAARP